VVNILDFLSSGAGSSPARTTKIGHVAQRQSSELLTQRSGFRNSPCPQTLGVINLRLTGSKLSIDYGVWCTTPPAEVRVFRLGTVTRGVRLGFESLLISRMP